MKITLSSNAEAVQQNLMSIFARQLPYAASQTVNDIAFAIKTATEQEFRAKFHLPTPWTMRAMAVVKDNTRDKTQMNPTGYGMSALGPRTKFSAWVGLKNPDLWKNSTLAPTRQKAGFEFYSDMYTRALAHQFVGGKRRFKRFEGALLRKRNSKGKTLIPAGMVAIPASGCPLDSYDNPKVGFIVQMQAYFDANPDIGSRQNMGEKGRKRFNDRLGKKIKSEPGVSFFISDGSQKLPAGIWRRTSFAVGTSLEPVFLFFRIGAYRKLIDLHNIGMNVVHNQASVIFANRISVAMDNDKQVKRYMKYG